MPIYLEKTVARTVKKVISRIVVKDATVTNMSNVKIHLAHVIIYITFGYFFIYITNRTLVDTEYFRLLW